MHHWCLHSACVDRHWVCQGVSKVADEAVVIPFVSSVFGGMSMCPMAMVSAFVVSCVTVNNCLLSLAGCVLYEVCVLLSTV